MNAEPYKIKSSIFDLEKCFIQFQIEVEIASHLLSSQIVCHSSINRPSFNIDIIQLKMSQQKRFGTAMESWLIKKTKSNEPMEIDCEFVCCFIFVHLAAFDVIVKM